MFFVVRQNCITGYVTLSRVSVINLLGTLFWGRPCSLVAQHYARTILDNKNLIVGGKNCPCNKNPGLMSWAKFSPISGRMSQLLRRNVVKFCKYWVKLVRKSVTVRYIYYSGFRGIFLKFAKKWPNVTVRELVLYMSGNFTRLFCKLIFIENLIFWCLKKMSFFGTLPYKRTPLY